MCFDLVKVKLTSYYTFACSKWSNWSSETFLGGVSKHFSETGGKIDFTPCIYVKNAALYFFTNNFLHNML